MNGDHDFRSSVKFAVRPFFYIAIALAFIGVMPTSSQSQTFTLLHAFAGGGQGGYPPAQSITLDSHGNLYGAAYVVFKLAANGSGWTYSPLFDFPIPYDGQYPNVVTVARDGSLYGATYNGGNNGCVNPNGCGTVFRLQPSPTQCAAVLCPWDETVVYRFTGNGSGDAPIGTIVFDGAGNLYGTTNEGGSTTGGCAHSNCGVVYKLTRSNGGWTQSVIYQFTGGNDGAVGVSGLVMDGAGNLYGVATGGQTYGCGTVYELTPSGSGWTETTIHDFTERDGCGAAGNPLIDRAGNVYVATALGGQNNAGTLVEFSPSNGNWSESVLHSFSAENTSSKWGLVIDSAGNFYGTTVEGGGYQQGSVFKLTQSGSGWTETTVHNFSDGLDGGFAFSLVLDQNGKLLGTTAKGGVSGYGTIWEITP
jgi:uncharacterized repeat protein (TIGR03803 family)